jgi:hypothetical protein
MYMYMYMYNVYGQIKAKAEAKWRRENDHSNRIGSVIMKFEPESIQDSSVTSVTVLGINTVL